MKERGFQLKTKEEVKEFAYIQMKIEDPNITPEYLNKDILAELKDSIEHLGAVLYELEKRVAHIEYHNYKPREYR